MAKNLGFFEKGKLEKLALNLPDHASDKMTEVYIDTAQQFGDDYLIHIATVLESLPSEWKDGPVSSPKAYRYYKLRKLCQIGIPATITPTNHSKLLDNIDDMPEDVATEILIKVGGDVIIDKMLLFLKGEKSIKRFMAIHVLEEIGNSTHCAQISEIAKEPKFRGASIRALGKLKCVDSLNVILTGLSDKDSNVVKASLDSLSQLPTDMVVDQLVGFAEPNIVRYERLMKEQILDLNELNRIRDILSAISVHKESRILSLMERVGNAMVPNIRGDTYSILRINEINNIVWKYTGNDKYKTQIVK